MQSVYITVLLPYDSENLAKLYLLFTNNNNNKTDAFLPLFGVRKIQMAINVILNWNNGDFLG